MVKTNVVSVQSLRPRELVIKDRMGSVLGGRVKLLGSWFFLTFQSVGGYFPECLLGLVRWDLGLRFVYGSDLDQIWGKGGFLEEGVSMNFGRGPQQIFKGGRGLLLARLLLRKWNMKHSFDKPKYRAGVSYLRGPQPERRRGERFDELRHRHDYHENVWHIRKISLDWMKYIKDQL